MNLFPTKIAGCYRVELRPLRDARGHFVSVFDLGEEAKVAIRNVRRDANEETKKLQKDGKISEDDGHREGQEIQKLTDRTIETVDEILHRKEKEILEI